MIPTTADAIMRAYVAAREARFAIGRVQLAMQGSASDCHNASTYFRHGVMRCIQCRQPCEERVYYEPRAGSAAGADKANRVHVHETRCVDREREFARLWVQTSRWLPLQRLVEPRPRAMTSARWLRYRLSLEAYLHPMVSGYAAVADLGAACHPDLGTWTEGSVRLAVSKSREVIERRASRRGDSRRARGAVLLGLLDAMEGT